MSAVDEIRNTLNFVSYVADDSYVTKFIDEALSRLDATIKEINESPQSSDHKLGMLCEDIEIIEGYVNAGFLKGGFDRLCGEGKNIIQGMMLPSPILKYGLAERKQNAEYLSNWINRFQQYNKTLNPKVIEDALYNKIIDDALHDIKKHAANKDLEKINIFMEKLSYFESHQFDDPIQNKMYVAGEKLLENFYTEDEEQLEAAGEAVVEWATNWLNYRETERSR